MPPFFGSHSILGLEQIFRAGWASKIGEYNPSFPTVTTKLAQSPIACLAAQNAFGEPWNLLSVSPLLSENRRSKPMR